MLTYEAVKELIFQESLSPWTSHTITVLTTAFLAFFVSIIVRRITLQKIQSARDAETRARSFLQTLLHSIPVAVFYKNREGHYLGCNSAFTQIMGVTEHDIRGKTVHELWPGELAEAYHQKDLELMEQRGSQSYEFQLKDTQGRMRDVIYSKAVFYDENDRVAGIIGSFFDITEKKQVERQLLKYQTHLESMIETKTQELLQKNTDLKTAMLAANAADRSKSLFLNKISHELRTPMNAISGYSQLLKHEMDDAEQLETVQSILESSNQMTKLINNLLDLSTCENRIRQAQTSEISFSDLFDDVLRPWQTHAQKTNLTLSSDIDPTLPTCPVTIDADKLRQILWHFLSNAFKFSQQGSVTLRARRSDCNGQTFEVRFEVEDQGIGIDPSQQLTIFQPFEQADNSITREYQGAGLGLAICMQLIDAMDGNIGVESTPGKGSTFWISIFVDV